MTCLECSTPLAPSNGPRPRKFCCPAHAKAFNNRRAMRGAQLVDLFMAMRYDRAVASEQGVWGFMCRMAEQWREEDIVANRQSFGDWREFMASNPVLNPSAVVRLPSMKFRRKG